MFSCVTVWKAENEKEQKAEKKKCVFALTRWLICLEYCPIHKRVVGSIPSQGTYLGCRFCPQSRSMGEATYQCISLTLCFSFSLSISLSLLSKGQDFLGPIFLYYAAGKQRLEVIWVRDRILRVRMYLTFLTLASSQNLLL